MALFDNIQNEEYTEFARFEDFKDLYKDMLAAIRKEPKDELDRFRAVKLTTKVDEAFAKYTVEDRNRAVQYLIKHGLAPQDWIELVECFNGSFKTVTNTDGGNNFRSF